VAKLVSITEDSWDCTPIGSVNEYHKQSKYIYHLSKNMSFGDPQKIDVEATTNYHFSTDVYSGEVSTFDITGVTVTEDGVLFRHRF